jgi:hypothetical protein
MRITTLMKFVVNPPCMLPNGWLSEFIDQVHVFGDSVLKVGGSSEGNALVW